MRYTVINVNGTYTLTMCMYVVTPLAHKETLNTLTWLPRVGSGV